MNLILLYSADSATSPESFALMAVCGDKETAVKIAAEAAGYTNEPLPEADRAALLEEYETGAGAKTSPSRALSLTN